MTIEEIQEEHIRDDAQDYRIEQDLRASGWIDCSDCGEIFDPLKEGSEDLALCRDCLKSFEDGGEEIS